MIHHATSQSRNSSLAQSLNDFCGSARSLTPSKLPSPRLEKHLNLAQDTRIPGELGVKFDGNTESSATTESRESK